jgi:hypothetical protein
MPFLHETEQKKTELFADSKERRTQARALLRISATLLKRIRANLHTCARLRKKKKKH